MSEQNQQQSNKQTPGEADQNSNSSASEDKQRDATNRNRENSNVQNSNKDDEPNPVYTNSDAPQQEIERDTQGVMTKGTKNDPAAIYNTDNSTLQSKEEKQHDENVSLNKNDKIDVPDLPETEIDKSISSER